jgi:hypothetical protein
MKVEFTLSYRGREHYDRLKGCVVTTDDTVRHDEYSIWVITEDPLGFLQRYGEEIDCEAQMIVRLL